MAVTGIVQVDGNWLDDNLHLTGLENNPDINYSTRTTLGGNLVVQTHPRNVGATIKLIARHDGSSRMGQFCSSHLDALKAVSALGVAVPIVHPAIDVADNVQVYVFEIKVEQSDEREPPGPNKKWHGEIILQEV